ncbi:BatA domain-containing protein [Mucilaginibacter galii]|uniref:Aerotolerance regulator N-terminal domain-containing protein n=1 Tax=Mucilaginibacter galii TaxID=2005073 RepID=A0A917N1T4_9SPHI|nr:BatA domain-containing protein [Mucilaginibacter galii]GGI49357.1 hypothetical protein GCM10011425_05690 [Mucilaginibacter galii]
MFQFLNPIWFFGAAALLIPVLLHLWNIRSGKVLKVGSISLIDAASRKSSRSFKLLDIPLFILRCLLLLILALLLALPVWQKKMEVAKVKGWVIFPKETFTSTYQTFKPTIDSLTKAGYEFHYFNPGFAKSNLTKIFLNAKDSLKTPLSAPKNTQHNYWDLVKELNSKVSSTLPVYVFTPNQATYFQGSKPQVALNLHWQTYTPADSAVTYIQDAWFTPSGDVRVVQGASKPSGTTYTYSNLRAKDKANTTFNINTTEGKAQISLAGGKQEAVTVDTAVQSLIIYADNNTTDAFYLKAALQAVVQFNQRQTVVKTVSNPAQIPANTSWLFWLSDKPLSKAASKNCKNILTYQSGKPATVSSWMSNAGQFATALPDQEKVNLYKSIAANPIYISVWNDGFGNMLLGLQHSGTQRIYHYYSRFNPAWNNLVWSDAFPAWMLKLLNKPSGLDTSPYDKRVLTAQQYLPQNITQTHTAATTKPFENKSLTRYFWLTLIIVFAAERWLAHRTPKTLSA